jgi:hypothetical protein
MVFTWGLERFLGDKNDQCRSFFCMIKRFHGGTGRDLIEPNNKLIAFLSEIEFPALSFI